MSKTGKVVAAAFGGAAVAGVAAFAYTLKRGFDELGEGQKVMAQTQAALKSTGGAANVTAKDIASLAEAQSKLTGIDDEAVQAGENMLLTFTKIRNEVGKGNDVFNQATVAIEDMATRMNDGAIPSGEQLSQTAIRVGKALNDPIRGMTALSRVGVQFDEGQRKTIKTMVEAGDTMGAQKLILAELTKEFGGSAKAAGDTMPGQLSKLRNSFDEVAGQLATKFLPILTGLVEWVNDHWPEISATIDAVGTAVAATFRAIGATVSWLRKQWEEHRETVIRTWNAVRDAVMNVVQFFQQNVVPAIRNVVTVIMALWDRFGADLVTVLRTTFGVVITLVQTWIQNMLAPLRIFLALLRGDFGAAWDEVKGIFQRNINAIGEVLRGALTVWATLAKALGRAILDGVIETVSRIGDLFRDKFINPIVNALRSAVETVKDLALKIVLAIVEPFSHLPSFLGAPFRDAKNKILDELGGIRAAAVPKARDVGYDVGFFMGLGLQVGIAAKVADIVASVYDAINTVLAALRAAAGTKSPSRYTMQIGHDLAVGLGLGWERGAKNVTAPALTALRESVMLVANAFGSIVTWAEKAERAITTFNPVWKDLPVAFKQPDIPAFAAGGIVRKKTLAWVGEQGPEMIIPLGSRMSVADVGGGPTYVVNVQGSVVTEREIAEIVRREFIRMGNRSPLGLPA